MNTTTTAKETQIAEQMLRLQKNVLDLHEAIAQLRSQLLPIMRNDASVGKECEAAPMPTLVGLADNLRDKNSGIIQAITDIRAMLNLLEL